MACGCRVAADQPAPALARGSATALRLALDVTPDVARLECSLPSLGDGRRVTWWGHDVTLWWAAVQLGTDEPLTTELDILVRPVGQSDGVARPGRAAVKPPGPGGSGGPLIGSPRSTGGAVQLPMLPIVVGVELRVVNDGVAPVDVELHVGWCVSAVTVASVAPPLPAPDRGPVPVATPEALGVLLRGLGLDP